MKFHKIPTFSMNSWPKQNFDDLSTNFWGMYCFKRLKLSAAYSLMVLMQLEIWANNSFYGANIPDENLLLLLFFSKRFGWICGLVLLYVKLQWNFLPWFESAHDLSCLQPWQHSVYQLCWCVWDHLHTLLLIFILAKVSNYSKKKSRFSTSKASIQLKYWKR